MTYAASQYQKQSGSYLSSREMEVMAFRHVNSLLTQAKDHEKKVAALAANLKLWSILSLSVERVDCPLPSVLRDDILKVGSWSMRYSNAAFNAAKDLQPLVDVNNDMIEGLSANTKPPVLTTTSSAYAGTTGQSSLELVG
ncbi:flagellar biosynthesis regulator FlaF [Gluconobacter kondonii]|uniref:flagellar biosynthesis regulator FlaF n=1 Tax=Gluconobacter kondonii TaxID=941463 RepID=UPI00197D0E9D|nr:flagellar biosynthesis regulator FlaF [Gluconobacter kondonii]MBN3866886.1 flagellin assembly protein [Gluconobacter kondonii]MBS1077219.1 flagellar biosynthesis regulator FlaF [Gluconobacter kondonii]